MSKPKREGVAWYVAAHQPSHGDKTVVVDEATHNIVCVIPSPAWDSGKKLRGAAKRDRINARMIARAPRMARLLRAAKKAGSKAPDLLEQLEAALHFIETPGDFSDADRANLQEDISIVIRAAKKAGIQPTSR